MATPRVPPSPFRKSLKIHTKAEEQPEQTSPPEPTKPPTPPEPPKPPTTEQGAPEAPSAPGPQAPKQPKPPKVPKREESNTTGLFEQTRPAETKPAEAKPTLTPVPEPEPVSSHENKPAPPTETEFERLDSDADIFNPGDWERMDRWFADNYDFDNEHKIDTMDKNYVEHKTPAGIFKYSARSAVEDYCGSSIALNVNQQLRFGKKYGQKVTIQGLDLALSISPPLKRNIRTYRTANLAAFGVSRDSDPKSIDGLEFVDKGFVSTSLDGSHVQAFLEVQKEWHPNTSGEDFAYVRLVVPAGTKVIPASNILYHKGKYSENELIVGRNGKYKVTKAYKSYGKWHIDMVFLGYEEQV